MKEAIGTRFFCGVFTPETLNQYILIPFSNTHFLLIKKSETYNIQYVVKNLLKVTTYFQGALFNISDISLQSYKQRQEFLV